MLSLYIMTIARRTRNLLWLTRNPNQNTESTVPRKKRAAGAAEGGCIHSSAVRLAAPFSRARFIFFFVHTNTKQRRRPHATSNTRCVERHNEIS